MAYWYNPIKKFNGNRKAFLADDASDIELLPNQTHEGTVVDGNNVVIQKVSSGSMVELISTGDKYMLNSAGTWVKLQQ